MLHCVIVHWPATQPGVPWATVHTVPHAPQLFASVKRSFSQPSATEPLQSPRFWVGVTWPQSTHPHCPFTQFAVPFGHAHTLPQVPQF